MAMKSLKDQSREVQSSLVGNEQVRDYRKKDSLEILK